MVHTAMGGPCRSCFVEKYRVHLFFLVGVLKSSSDRGVMLESVTSVALFLLGDL